MRQKKENYEEVNTAGVLDGINKVLKNISSRTFETKTPMVFDDDDDAVNNSV